MVQTVLLLLLAGQAAAAGSAGAERAPVRDEALRKELLAMAKVDQDLRFRLAREGRRPSTKKLADLQAKVEAVDHANTRRIKEIVAARGWPGRSLVGQDGAQAAFLLVQHADADLAFQQATLPLVEQAFAAGEADGQTLALLTDRVLVAEGKPQLYGSQMLVEGGVMRLRPTVDEATLDERRARLGLPPMREYLKLLEEMYGLPAGR